MNTTCRLLLRRTALCCACLTLSLSGSARAQIVAHSANEFSGNQGQNGWHYGHFQLTGDANGVYDRADFQAFPAGAPAAGEPNRFGFRPNLWDYYSPTASVNPPWTEIGPWDTHPNGTNNTNEQWTVRRYEVQAADVAAGNGLAVMWRASKTNPNGGGVTSQLYHNGNLLNSTAIPFNDRVGAHGSAFLPAVQAGDHIDLIYSPVGPTGDRADGSDGGHNVMKIRNNATPFVPYSAPVVPLLTSFDVAQYANSIADYSGVQGQNNWSYGYYNRSLDISNNVDDQYNDPFGDFTEFPAGDPVVSAEPARFGFRSNRWDWIDPANAGNDGQFFANPPWTTIRPDTTHPNGTNNGQEHWTVRRWTSEVSGDVRIVGQLQTAGFGGGNDGTTGRIFVNGFEVFSMPSINTLQNYSVDLNVQEGDLVDFIVDNGPSRTDGSDTTRFTAQIAQPFIIDVLADSQADFSGTQGSRGFRYGFWNRSADERAAGGDGLYAPQEFSEFAPGHPAPGDPNRFAFDGTDWDWRSGNGTDVNPPWTQVTADGGHPNGENNGDAHWAIRRWVSSVDGVVRLEGTLNSPGGTAGGRPDGAVGRIYVDGYEVWHGFTRTDALNVLYSLFVDVNPGSTIDFVIDAGLRDSDGSDGTTFTTRISRAIPEPSTYVLALAGMACVLLRRKRSRK